MFPSAAVVHRALSHCGLGQLLRNFTWLPNKNVAKSLTSNVNESCPKVGLAVSVPNVHPSIAVVQCVLNYYEF
jgi:hypothetical protein